MCMDDQSAQSSGVRRMRSAPYGVSGYEQLTMFAPDAESPDPQLPEQASFVLTCELSGVRLTKTFKLPLRWLTTEAGERICGAFASALIQDAGLVENSR